MAKKKEETPSDMIGTIKLVATAHISGARKDIMETTFGFSANATRAIIKELIPGMKKTYIKDITRDYPEGTKITVRAVTRITVVDYLLNNRLWL